MFEPITVFVHDWDNDWDEVPEKTVEQIEEEEAIESYTRYGFHYLLTHDGAQAFSKWWNKRGRFMNRPLELDLPQE